MPDRMERGFTLLEVAIAVVVVSFLLAGLLGPLGIRIEQQERRKTSDQLEEIKEALYGLAMAKGALPCPDSFASGDGLAEPTCAAGTEEGWLPFRDLGVAPGDAWGFRYRYRVTIEFTKSKGPTADGVCTVYDGDLELCDTGDVNVVTHSYTTPHPPILVATNMAAVILSQGKNGLGATRIDSRCIPATTGVNCMPPAPGNSAEQINADSSRLPGSAFVSRHYTTIQTPCDDTDPNAAYCEFDDMVVWISPPVLLYRLVQAERLP